MSLVQLHLTGLSPIIWTDGSRDGCRLPSTTHENGCGNIARAARLTGRSRRRFPSLTAWTVVGFAPSTLRVILPQPTRNCHEITRKAKFRIFVCFC